MAVQSLHMLSARAAPSPVQPSRRSAIRFTKMHGIGNDYIYVNAFVERVENAPALATAISNRHFGVGSDGLILIGPPDAGVDADVRMRMFNADGSESEMCGNGVRCVAKYAVDHGLSKRRPIRVQTGRGVLSIDYTLDAGGRVSTATVDMGEPILDPRKIPVDLPRLLAQSRIVDVPLWKYIPGGAPGGASWMEDCGLDARMTCLSMGNPHMVMFCARVAAAPLETLGSEFERQPIFPNRINVHFVEVISRGELTMRTWERGSGITLACGTGAAAVCVAGVLTGRSDRDVLIHLPGGDLNLRWDEESGHVFKTGPATEVFSGEWEMSA
jgi:diaminopimelate epimerase